MLRNVSVAFVVGLLVAGGPGPLFAQSADAARAPAAPVRAVTAPLSPGGAAGIKQAQAQRGRIWNFAPFALVGGLAALVVLMNDDDGDTTTATTSGTN